MSTFRLYLWKEWREQRTALLALALMLPVLVTAIGFNMPRSRASGATFIGVTSAVALALTLVAVSGELLSFDRRRGGQWLERLPRGVAAAFPAKLSVFLGSSVLALVYGALLSAIVGLLRSRSPATAIALERDLEPLWIPIGCALVVAPWVFSASAWCARGMLAFAAGTLLAGGLGFPLIAFEFTGYRPEAGEIVAGLTFFLGGALASAWIGFVHGSSLGRGFGRAALIGGGSGMLSLAPILGWGLFQLHERNAFDLASPNSEMDCAWVSADGRVAVISARMRHPKWRTPTPTRTFWIDLQSRTGLDLDNNEADFHELLIQRGAGVWSSELLLSGKDDLHCIDTATGARLTSWDEPLAMRWKAGLGYASYDSARSTHVYHDPFSGRSMTRAELAEPYDAWISSEGWFLWTPDWLFYDPYRDALEAAPWIPADLSGLTVCPDGRLLAEGASGTLALVDASARSITPLSGLTLEGPFEVVDDSFEAPHELLFRADSREYLLDLECLEFAPLPLKLEEYLMRRLADGTLVVWTPAGLDWREAGGKTVKSVSWSDLELSEEVTP